MQRAQAGYEITDVMQGDKKLDLVNIWVVSDPKKTMQGIFKDPDYQQHIQLRDSIFDMKKSIMFFAKKADF